ncbi:hypothetical protein C8A01DRAFT_47139 [Parachaetomium inaequale]|uniref:Uncharacterized protein n=1 Tax=Parachaetomium inaequale TaxID=2588326 RepID=A0AAN6PG25_9PEZI|nr:hypothetical protein C8A01DRAFT_47139 [Parachaetomium inaequale]
MSDSEAAISKPLLSVRDILAFEDAELAEYMQRHRGPDGGFDLDDIERWDALPEDQRDKLAERLKFGAQQADEAMHSCPISAGQDAASQPLSRPSRFDRSPTVEVDPNEEIEQAKRFETAAYQDLINDGGQPAYPINLLEKVSEDPEPYREVLLPWQEYPDKGSLQWQEVFHRQFRRWQDFRAWQQDNRGIVNDEAGFLAFVDANDKAYAILGTTWQKMWPRETESRHRESLKEQWECQENKRKADHYWLRGGCKHTTFSEYADDQVQHRLARHGFTLTFKLPDDSTQQDQLTTWIEYLNFEYSWLDRYARLIEMRRREDIKAWQKLMDSGVLRRHETIDFLSITESQIQRQAELNKATSAVASAENAARSALGETEKAKHGRSRYSVQERVKRLAEAQSRLTAAKDSLKEVNERLHLIATFIWGQGPYWTAKRDLLRHELLVQWILDQRSSKI